MNLYDISSELRMLSEKAEADLLTEEDKEQLATLKIERKIKLENYARVIRSLEADVEAYKKELQDLTKKRKRAEANINWLKKEAQADLQKHDQKKMKTGVFTWTRISLAPRLTVVDGDELPLRFKEIRTEEVISKQKIHDEFKETGEIFPGTDLEVKESIRLR